MITIDQYVDLIRARHGLKSDRQLANFLGFASGAVTQWRTKRSWPSDNTIIKMAKLAGLSETHCLIHLNYWRCDGQAKQNYQELHDLILLCEAGKKSHINQNNSISQNGISNNVIVSGHSK